MRSFARITTASVLGAGATLVDVQASVASDREGGDSTFRIVGLPDSALREGRDRIRGAVIHGGWPWPYRPLTVNLAPAAARKEGASLDLPIALAVLGAEGVLGPEARLREWFCLGELTLDGGVRPVRGVLAGVEAARARGTRRAVVPRRNAAEAAAVEGTEVYGVESLAEAVGLLIGEVAREPEPLRPWKPAPPDERALLALRGQPQALRAAVTAAVGGHNLMLWGPPGTGKTMLARLLAELLPPLTREEALEASRVHSVAGLLEDGLVVRRPFRAPHHTTSLAGLVGGGAVPRPGELSLAHLGVLFLDEMAEFDRASLEALRQPLEEGRLVVGRAAGRAVLPADVLLVAAMNPCPCGWKGVTRPADQECKCTERDIRRYQSRISGPLRDRFDLEVQVGAVDPAELVRPTAGPLPEEATPAVRERARRMQARRARRLGLPRPFNARIPARLLPGGVDLAPGVETHLVEAARSLGLSARAIHRCMRVARTLADLEGVARVDDRHLLEAVNWRT